MGNSKLFNCIPQGFYFNGIHSGIVKNKTKLDLGLFYSTIPCNTAGMFTRNQVKAAPVLVSQTHIRQNATQIRAIIANSGCANACTGSRGVQDAKDMTRLTASKLGVRTEQVLVASTGVIGKYLPMERVNRSIPRLCTFFTQKKDPQTSPLSAVNAIMTTDTVPKIASTHFYLNNKKVTIWGCAKGAGMLHPDLEVTSPAHATFFCFLFTDLAISQKLLTPTLTTAVNQSFHCITVDGDTSTNDTVLLLANGSASNEPIVRKDKFYLDFQNKLNTLCLDLAQQLIQDGEGVTKLVRINVTGALSVHTAQLVGRTVATSPLVKTAVFGNDPNWGRIMAAVGRSGVKINPEKIDLWFDKTCIYRQGTPQRVKETKLKQMFTSPEITVTINLHQGKAQATIYTGDLSTDYVKINASYTT